MIKIAHRGNFAGRNPKLENTPDYVSAALSAGFDVEIDVWFVDDRWWLGHDSHTIEVDLDFLEQPRLWIHAKNIDACFRLHKNPSAHVFWHNRDKFAITSMGFKWANAGVLTNDGIMVMPEYVPGTIGKILDGMVTPLGVCSDDLRPFNKL